MPIPPQSGLVHLQVTGGDEAFCTEFRPDLNHWIKRDVEHGNAHRRQLHATRVAKFDLDLDAVRLSVVFGDRDRGRVEVDPDDRREAKARRRYCEHARATADVEQSSRLQVEQMTEAEHRRRVSAGTERAPRLDYDRDGI